MPIPNHDKKQPMNCEGPVGDHCTMVQLEPTWTFTFLREEQETDSDLKVITVWKEASEINPLWEDVLPQSHAGKTL